MSRRESANGPSTAIELSCVASSGSNPPSLRSSTADRVAATRAASRCAGSASTVRAFCSWADARGLTLGTLRTHHVAAYVELLGKHYSPPTVKQHLAAVRMLFDWLVVRQVLETNPAAAVRNQPQGRFIALGMKKFISTSVFTTN